MSENKNSKDLKKVYTIKNEEKKNGELTLLISVKSDFVNNFREKAIKSAGKDLEVKGFRKGSAPEKVVVDTVGEMKILEEQAYQSLYEIVPYIVIEQKIEALTHPKISITKIADGSDLEFKATFALIPDVEIPDYKKIAKGVERVKKVEVSDKEVDEYIDYIRKQKAQAEFMKKKTSGKPGSDKLDPKEAEKLPELNDEFIKTLGEFKDVSDFKKQLKENMLRDKEVKAKQSRRIGIIDKIVEETKVDMPDILVEEELERMKRQFEMDIERYGIKIDDYLKEIKKTPEDLKKEWRPDAIKSAKTHLILPKIAAAEKISPDMKKVEEEVKHLQSHHKDINPDHARAYVTHALANEMVFQFLEELK